MNLQCLFLINWAADLVLFGVQFFRLLPLVCSVHSFKGHLSYK